MTRMLGEPDPRPCIQSTVNVVCVRGMSGCQLDHAGPPIIVAVGLEACISTSGRWSPDFEGATE